MSGNEKYSLVSRGTSVFSENTDFCGIRQVTIIPYHPKTGLENRYKGLFNESKLGNMKNITELAKVAFTISRLQQEKIGYKLQDNSKHGFKRAQSGIDILRSKSKNKGSDLQDNVKHGKKTMESTKSQTQLILRSQSRTSLVKLQDCRTVSIIHCTEKRRFQWFSILH